MAQPPKQILPVLGRKMDTIALISSAIYFLLFIASLGCITSKQCSGEGKTGLTALRIISLVLPMIYFGKLLKDHLQNKDNSNKFQLGILFIYFFLVFIFLCSEAASNFEAAKNINTLALYILPILIFLSFYNTYEMWKDGKTPKSMIYLNLTLSILYYSLFYFSLQYGESMFGEFGSSALNGILIAISIVLVGLFSFRAMKTWKGKE